METIEVTKEMFDKLIELSNEINSQDHRATAMPYIFQIQTDEKVPAAEGCGTTAYVNDGTMIESKEEINNAILDWLDVGQDINNMSDFAKAEILEKAGYRKVQYEVKQNLENAFFTAKACKHHIECNRHHYNSDSKYNPVDYLSYAFRNPEMELIFEFLCGLTGKKYINK